MSTTTNPVVFTQPDRRFSGKPAYKYLRATDRLPSYDAMGEDPMVKVKLFTSGRYTLYVCAATDYGDGQIVVTGHVLSALGPDCDEFGDASMNELAALRARPFGLPVERDIHFTPMRLSELRAKLAKGEHV